MSIFCSRFVIIILFICLYADLLLGESGTIVFPDEEEVYEAYQEGLIDFEEYSRLKEITARVYPNREDTLYIQLFPDLLAGSAPVLVVEEQTDDDHDDGQVQSVDITDGTFLFRRYQNLRVDGDYKWSSRFSLQHSTVQIYGAFDHEYSGRNHWERRYVDMPLVQQESFRLKCSAGNYNHHMGMGVIYGYHGRLFNHSSSAPDADKFLFPDYGGGNGCLFQGEIGRQRFTILLDADRNDEFGKSLAAMSWTSVHSNGELSVNGLNGRVKGRSTHLEKTYTLISLSGRQRSGHTNVEFEAAAAPGDTPLPVAGAFEFHWRRGKNSLTSRGWHYDEAFPSPFSGGPSARRYKTVEVEELGLSYRDRWSGESGGLVTTNQPLTESLSLSMATLYSHKSMSGNRLEYRIGLKRRLSCTIRGELDCYWRGDNLYSENQTQRRVQTGLIWQNDAIRVRIVGGHRHDPYNAREDYLAFAEGRFKERMGQLILYAKLDRLIFSDIKNNYTYFAMSHDAQLTNNLHLYAKYSYRYRRGSDTGTYGQFRWDMEWTF